MFTGKERQRVSDKMFYENDGMDEDSCLRLYDNSYEFYKLVLETFVGDIKKTLDGMRKNLAAGDPENYRIFVHGLKGAGGSAGAKDLVELATKSNALIKEGKWDEAKQLHEPIIAELERLQKIIPERIKAKLGE